MEGAVSLTSGWIAMKALVAAAWMAYEDHSWELDRKEGLGGGCMEGAVSPMTGWIAKGGFCGGCMVDA